MAKFFISLLLPGSEKKMRIPARFARLLTTFNTVSILSPLGKTWDVELRMYKTNTYFTNGWPEFLKAHEIQHGYSMVFSHKEQSNFSIEIFDNTSCLKEYNGTAHGKRNAQREGHQAHDVSHDGTNADDSYTGSADIELETTKAKYLKDKKGKKATIPSNVDKKTQNSNKQNRGVNQRGKRSQLVKNVNSSASMKITTSVSGSNKKNSGIIAINKDYSLRYLPLRKGFCDDSQYELTEGMATVRNERQEAYPVKYKVCGNYNNLGKGWSKFCEANGIRLGDLCLIKIIGNNKFLVKIKRH